MAGKEFILKLDGAVNRNNPEEYKAAVISAVEQLLLEYEVSKEVIGWFKRHDLEIYPEIQDSLDKDKQLADGGKDLLKKLNNK